MVGNRVTPKDASAYIVSVRETFRDERAKYKEFLMILKNYINCNDDDASTVAKMEELLKDHQELLRGLQIFLPAQQQITPIQDMVGNRVTDKVASAYINSMKETYRDEPAKFHEFLKTLEALTDSMDEASAVARVKELLKDHQELLRGLHLFVLATDMRIQDFARKLKTSFNPQVCDSFLAIMGGNKSENEVHAEVAALLQGREDLVMEFRSIYDPLIH